MAPHSKRTVLITGCSNGGLGAALAIAFHQAGLHVYATARNPVKLSDVKAHGIETLTLDVTSKASIDACVAQVPHLDVLVNNAGSGHGMPIADLDIDDAKRIFDLNVWSCIAVTQAFLPLLVKSKGLVVNHTSSASVTVVPFQSAYNASKAAMAMFNDVMRLEFSILGVGVVEMKTGIVKSHLIDNNGSPSLPQGSIYEPAREVLDKALAGDNFKGQGTDADVWAKQVVGDIIKDRPAKVVWRGDMAGTMRIASCLPSSLFEGTVKKATKFPEIEKAMNR